VFGRSAVRKAFDLLNGRTAEQPNALFFRTIELSNCRTGA